MDTIFNFLFVINNLVESNYLISILIYLIFIYFYSFFSLPGMVFIWVFSGFVFGTYLGYLISIIFSVLGFLSLFLVSKFILSSYLYKFFKNKIIKIEKIIHKSSYEILILFRMLPINFPYLIQNIALSFLNISSLKFIIVTFFGITPIVFFCSLVGNTLEKIKEIKEFSMNDLFTENFIFIFIILIFFIFIRIYFKIKKETKKTP